MKDLVIVESPSNPRPFKSILAVSTTLFHRKDIFVIWPSREKMDWVLILKMTLRRPMPYRKIRQIRFRN